MFMLEEKEKHLVKFCQCTFAQYLNRLADNESDEDDNLELSSDISNNYHKEEEKK